MIKKIATVAGAAALLLGSAAPVLAIWDFNPQPQPVPSYEVVNTATVVNDVYAKADTGDNDQDVKGAGYNYLNTGDATAGASAFTFANIFDWCNCGLKGDVTNNATVMNNVKAKAYTGDNEQDVWGQKTYKTRWSSHTSSNYNKMYTGDAEANAMSWTVVNADWAPMMPF